MSGKKSKVDRWNWEAFFKSFYWYGVRGMNTHATLMIIFIMLTVWVGFIPLMIYCGKRGNRDYHRHLSSQRVGSPLATGSLCDAGLPLITGSLREK